MKTAAQTDPLKQALRTLFAFPLNLMSFGWSAIRDTHRRKRPRTVSYPVATPWTDEPPVATPWSEADEVQALLSRGMSQQEAAKALGISRKALRRRLAAAHSSDPADGGRQRGKVFNSPTAAQPVPQ